MKPRSDFQRERARAAKRGRGRPRGIPWQKVERMARTGSGTEEIRAALRLSEIAPEDLARMDALVRCEHAVMKADLRRELLKIAKKGTRGKGVTAALALARNLLGFDSSSPDVPTAQLVPDLERAAAEIEALLTKLTRGWKPCPACGSLRPPSPEPTKEGQGGGIA